MSNQDHGWVSDRSKELQEAAEEKELTRETLAWLAGGALNLFIVVVLLFALFVGVVEGYRWLRHDIAAETARMMAPK